MSHSSMSAAEFGAENLLRPLSQIRLGLKGCEERQVTPLFGMLCHPAADQLQGWPQLSLRKLIHQMMEFIAHRAHERSLRPRTLQRRLPAAAAATALVLAVRRVSGVEPVQVRKAR